MIILTGIEEQISDLHKQEGLLDSRLDYTSQMLQVRKISVLEFIRTCTTGRSWKRAKLLFLYMLMFDVGYCEVQITGDSKACPLPTNSVLSAKVFNFLGKNYIINI